MEEFGKTVHYLYKIENLINGKVYIGVTKDVKTRRYNHLRRIDKWVKNKPVNNAVRKYGAENFSFTVLCVGEEDYIYDLEVKAIAAFNSYAPTGHGYNLYPGGKGGSGRFGQVIKSRSDDEPVFVSGFWFPNPRTAMRSLNWKQGLYNGRKRTGVLGDVCFIQTKHGPQNPVFVSGFWFPCKKVAMESLNWGFSKYGHRQRNGQLHLISLKENNSNGV